MSFPSPPVRFPPAIISRGSTRQLFVPLSIKSKTTLISFASECLSMVRKAADWEIESAADNDKRKAKFLEGVSQRKGRDFLRYVLEAYQEEQDTSVPVGSNGAAIGSGDYLQHMERDVFLSDLQRTLRIAGLYGFAAGFPRLHRSYDGTGLAQKRM